MKKYVSKHEYSSTDWHDMSTVVTQLEENGSYEIKNPVEFIVQQIHAIVKEYGLSLEAVKENMQKGSHKINLCVYDNEDDESQNVDSIEFHRDKDSYSVRFESVYYTYVVTFIIQEIEDENVGYLVSEHIVNPGKGYDLTERCYREVFDDLESAKAYMDVQNRKERHYRHSESGFKLTVVDKNYMTNDMWYKMNLECVRLCASLDENIDDYIGYVSAQAILGVLQEKAYAAFDDDARFKEDVEVYQLISPFLTQELQHMYDQRIEKNQFTREDADKALIMAFIHAKSQKEYDAIHKALQVYVTRIGQLTKHILNEHHGHGLVAVDTQGNIQWYENGYAINSWEEAKNNPYFGKLVYCMSYAGIEHFREYKEGRFVEKLPTVEEVESWNAKYRETRPKQLF